MDERRDAPERPELEIALLRTLCLLGEDPHVGRTAQRLGISQQAASQRITRLERQLGREVLDRSARPRVHLTPSARALLPWAQAVIDAADRLSERLVAEPSDLRVDVMDTMLAPVRWMRRTGRVDGTGEVADAIGTEAVAVITRSPDASAASLLLSGRADLAFGRLSTAELPLPDGVRHALVHLEPLSLLVAREHRWAGRDAVRCAELAGERVWFPMVMAPLEWRLFVEELAARTGLLIETGGSALGFEPWAQEVSCGARPPSLFGEAMDLPTADTVTVPLADPTPVFPWSAFWREEDSARVEGLLREAGLAIPPRIPEGTWMPAADRRALETHASIDAPDRRAR